MDYKLFSINKETAGYRLDYMEVFNWGTFDKKVWHINPEGNTTLLTGGNGSGKTTFIDALLTLIVPFKKDRSYNQSSGEELSGARSEKSYVLGHYGNRQDEETLSETKLMLRDEKAVSILLASFKNNEDKICTVFQCRWFSNGDLKTQFGIAHKPVRIKTDFFPFDNKRKWKDRLIAKYPDVGRGSPIEFFNLPGEYGERISRLFGMRSSRALSLFNQVVGIKYVEDLNLFFSKHLLEDKESQARNEYEILANSFTDLTTARNDIEKAEEQLKRLSPINVSAKKLAEINKELKDLEEARQTSVYWFAKKGEQLCLNEQGRLEKLIKKLEQNLIVEKGELEKLRDKEAQLKVDFNNSEPGRQIKALEAEIDIIKGKRQESLAKSKEYNNLARKIGFSENPDEKLFETQQSEASDKKDELEKTQKRINEDIRNAESESKRLRNDIEELKESITALRKNNNNIPKNVSRIREQILKAVGASKKEIPFIGELIKVNENHLVWEKGIEKLLHSFALRIIVPEEYYKKVNKYVNSTDLKGKIFYQRFKNTDTLLDIAVTNDQKKVFQKLDFKLDSDYKKWIKEQVYEQFNFYCANDLLDFENSKKAITKEGLIKYGGGRHQKDDSKRSLDRSSYVLGWDNTSKIKLYREKLSSLTNDETNTLVSIGKLETQLENVSVSRDNHFTFSSLFQKYSDIDWEKYVGQIQSRTNRIEEITSSNDVLKTLESQLKKIKEKIDNKEISKDDIKDETALVKSKLNTAQDRAKNNERDLSRFEGIEIETSKLEAMHPQIIEITYDTAEKLQTETQEEVNNSINELENSQNILEKDARKLMQDFVLPGNEILRDFPSWRSDINGLKIDIDLIQGYVEKYKDLTDDNLPKFKIEFDKLLKQTIFQNVEKFKSFFESWKDEIEKVIESLNDALIDITLNTTSSETYLQLNADYKTTKTIDSFKLLLRNATPNFKEHNSLEKKKQHFDENIEPLITKLGEEKWRNSVMDVRRWYQYKTNEYYKSSNNSINTVSSMAGLSGGEKASLTYTVLGAAISYQFGLTSNNYNNNSFNFVAIDEAFKGQDPDHAEYLMKLCKQLNLQLLVVTPSDKMKIVQPYISYIHLIEKQNKKNSIIRNMPIYTYEQGEKNRNNQ